jgi:transcriptional regulator with XRE-family HTH domain
MNVLVEIGRGVRRERREHGLTQEALALRAGISRGYLDVEWGKRDLSVTVLFKILAAFGSPDLRDVVAGGPHDLEPQHLLLKIVQFGTPP